MTRTRRHAQHQQIDKDFFPHAPHCVDKKTAISLPIRTRPSPLTIWSQQTTLGRCDDAQWHEHQHQQPAHGSIGPLIRKPVPVELRFRHRSPYLGDVGQDMYEEVNMS